MWGEMICQLGVGAIIGAGNVQIRTDAAKVAKSLLARGEGGDQPTHAAQVGPGPSPVKADVIVPQALRLRPIPMD